MKSGFDLVEVLRRNPLTIMTGDNITAEAADEIERLRNALRKIYGTGDDGTQDEIAPDMWAACREFAQEALNYD